VGGSFRPPILCCAMHAPGRIRCKGPALPGKGNDWMSAAHDLFRLLAWVSEMPMSGQKRCGE
jgi:hypothetical protein